MSELIARVFAFCLNFTFQTYSSLVSDPKKRANFLSSLLRSHPLWAEGHLLYAKEQISILKISSTKDLRAVAALRVSGAAILTLQKKKNKRELELESKFLIAMGDFFAKHYEQALRGFAALLDGEQVNLLSEFSYYTALEYAGLTAVLLEEKEMARQYFSLIPKEKQSAEVRAVGNLS